MPSIPADTAIVNIGNVAVYLTITESTICPLAGAKRFAASEVGRDWRFSKTVIDGWIKDQIQWNQRALPNKSNSSLTPIFWGGHER